MSMFDNYENLREDYIPNNTEVPKLPLRKVIHHSFPIKEKNIVGKFVGCSFNYGDTLPLEFYFNPTVLVEENAIILESNSEPSSATEGLLGQRAYNGNTMREWVCETLDQSTYSWREEKEFTIPNCGTKELTVKPFGGNPQWAKAEVVISNFRREKILSFSTEDGTATIESNSVKISITDGAYKSNEEDLREAPKKLLKGVYNATLTLSRERNDEYNTKVLYEYTLIIK